jgi:WD40 repeat protein
MAVVFEAEEKGLGRRVALKIFDPRFDRTLVDTQRFRREAEAGSKLQHPAVVRVYRRGVHDQIPFIASELVTDGRNMDQLCQQWKEQPDSRPKDHVRMIAEWFANIAEAMDEAHQKGILHRDLKLANLLVSGDGRPFVADFGLAWMDDRRGLSQSGEMVGTPFFMSPEQVASGSLSTSERADIYSLGASLYQMLVLERPFEASQAEQVFHRILHEEPAHPRKIQPKLPADLVHICLKAMDRTPQRRYASMAEFAADLHRFLRYEPVLAKAPSTFHRLRRWQERHPASFVAVLLLAVMATILVRGGQMLHGSDEAKKRAQTGWTDARSDRYDILMRAADEAIQGFRYDDAANLLELCELPLRNWPWRHAQRQLVRHRKTLRSAGGHRLLTLAVHPEGKFVVGGFGNGSVLMWRTSDGELVREFERFTLGVYATAFSPDGHYVAAAGDNAIVHVYDTETLELVTSYSHWAGVGCIVFGPQSDWVASCDDAGQVNVWELAEGTTLMTAEVSPRAVFMDVSADGKRIAVANGFYGVDVLSTTTGLPVTQTLQAHNELVYDLRFLPGDRYLATVGADQMMHFWDLENEGERVFGGNPVNSALNSIGMLGERSFLLGDKAGMVSEVHWTKENQLQVRDQWRAHFAFANVVRLSPTGEFVVTGGDDGAVHLWNVHGDSDRLVNPSAPPVAVNAAFSASNVMAVADANGSLKAWNQMTGQSFASFQEPVGEVQSMALSRDGQMLATISENRDLWLTATATGLRTLLQQGEDMGDAGGQGELKADGEGEEGDVKAGGGGESTLAFSPEGRQLLMVRNRQSFQWFDVDRGQQKLLPVELRERLQQREGVLGMHWDGKQRLWLLRESQLQVLDTSQKDWPMLKAYDLAADDRFGHARFISPRSSHGMSLHGVAVATSRGVLLFETQGAALPNDDQVRWLPVEADGLSSLAWHGTETTLAGGFEDGQVRIWNARSGGVCSVWQAHSAAVHALRFSTESDWLISAADDGKMQFWGTPKSPWPQR